MIHFESDYAEGAHEKVLQLLIETNMDQTEGYGLDGYCESARALIRKACKADTADIHFLVGGTQTNTVIIASILRPHQGAIAASTGHIAMHESGAIEATGHKVLTIPSDDGKLYAEQLAVFYEEYLSQDGKEHLVQPGLVYISHSTENGTCYTKKELSDLSALCHKYELPLIMDGARLGYALMAVNSDLSLEDIAELCDIFYIGGTKVGALFGEAVVITNDKYKKDFRSIMKQQGALLAKGRLLGLQFKALFTDNLYFEISKHAVDQAMRIRDAILAKGLKLRYDSMSNQQFVYLSKAEKEKLGRKYLFSPWEKYPDGTSSVRICTSWATKDEAVDMLIEDIKIL